MFKEALQTLRRSDLRGSIQRVYISLDISVIQGVYLQIHRRKVFLIHFGPVFFEHGRKYFLINRQIQVIVFLQ